MDPRTKAFEDDIVFFQIYWIIWHRIIQVGLTMNTWIDWYGKTWIEQMDYVITDRDVNGLAEGTHWMMSQTDRPWHPRWWRGWCRGWCRDRWRGQANIRYRAHGQCLDGNSGTLRTSPNISVSDVCDEGWAAEPKSRAGIGIGGVMTWDCVSLGTWHLVAVVQTGMLQGAEVAVEWTGRLLGTTLAVGRVGVPWGTSLAVGQVGVPVGVILQVIWVVDAILGGTSTDIKKLMLSPAGGHYLQGMLGAN